MTGQPQQEQSQRAEGRQSEDSIQSAAAGYEGAFYYDEDGAVIEFDDEESACPHPPDDRDVMVGGGLACGRCGAVLAP